MSIDIIFISLGILLGVFFFLKIWNTTGSILLTKKKKKGKAVYIEKPKYPKPRYCPICKAPLKKHESLYATMLNKDSSKPKVIIHGCRYCYKPKPGDEEIDIDL
jgi:rubredoxin